MYSLTELLVFAVVFLVTITISKKTYSKRKSKLPDPPFIPSLPIIGSLPFMRVSEHLAKYFIKKSKELGPIFTFKIGSRSCLVLNSFEVIEEALVKNSIAFSGREIFFSETYAGNNNHKGIIAHEYGERFRYYQKLTLSILKEFGFGDKRVTETRVSTEVVDLIELIKAKNGEPFDPEPLILHASANVSLSILFAKRHSYDNGLNTYATVSSQAIESINAAIERAPWLRFFPYFKQKAEHSTRCFGKAMDCIEGFVNDVLTSGNEDCFVLKYVEKEGPNYDREQLLYTARDFIFASNADVTGSMLWALLFLANNPAVQRRLQKDIDEIVPRDKLPSIDDRSKLPYLEATISEAMRIKTLSPLSVARKTLTDTEIAGFYIPSGTMVMPNLYAVHMDPTFWKDPEVFRPERFLDSNNKAVNTERCVPFSLGRRRSCPGEGLAKQELYQFISGLVQNFVIKPPHGQEKLDEEEETGEGIVLKPKHFQLQMIPREPTDGSFVQHH